MPIYQVRGQKDLVRLAGERGWIEVSGGGSLQESVPAVEVVSMRKQERLPAETVETYGSEVLRIPEAMIHGRNFSLLIDDCIYPGGFTHSFRASSLWQPEGTARVRYEPRRPVDIETAAPRVLGIVSHWGHFFCDALDRVFRLEETGRWNGAMLVSDADFFGLGPRLDGCGAVPQVSELMERLGRRLGSPIALSKDADYRVRDLTLCTLRSKKPVISSPTIRKLRERLFGAEPQYDASGPVLFVGRADVRKRFIVGQEALVDRLTARGVTTIYPEHLSTDLAIEAFASAAAVILPIGSAKWNLAYCAPGTKVVCIVPRGYSKVRDGVVMMVRHLCATLRLRLALYEVEMERHEVLLNSNLIIGEGDVEQLLRILGTMH